MDHTLVTVGELAASDVRLAAVLERFGIDICRAKDRTLADACRAGTADPERVVAAIEALTVANAEHDDVSRWPIPRLIDFIVSVHHAYVRSSMPALTRHLTKLMVVHGDRHPELARISAEFDQVVVDLTRHMLKEEQVLFPYVRELAGSNGGGPTQSPFGTVANPIRMMEREHQDVAGALRLIRHLTRDYAAPDDGCVTYAVAMAELREFERDLNRHVDLENNVLFPAALRLEQNLSSAVESDRR